jgi:hypothetical protein
MVSKGTEMDHVAAIRKYIEAICTAKDLHALIVCGNAGWGKTTAVHEALNLAGMEGVSLGGYSTALNLYNTLAVHHDKIVVADDVAGIFNDSAAMAILKAATWPTQGGRRIVRWGTTSSKATAPEFEFTGKLIIVSNSFPESPDGDAIRSRGYERRIEVSLPDAKALLRQAAQDPKWFESTELAQEVAEFLVGHLNETTLPLVSFRTLMKGYRLAERHRDSWRDLFTGILPKSAPSPEKLVKELSRQKLKVKDQVRIFEEKTGLSVRSFYNYRKEARLSRKSAR